MTPRRAHHDRDQCGAVALRGCSLDHAGQLAQPADLGCSQATSRPRRARADEVGLIESSLVLCGESGLLGEVVEGVLVVACGGAQGAGCGWVGIGELGQAGVE